jgi:hypothetical protein
MRKTMALALAIGAMFALPRMPRHNARLILRRLTGPVSACSTQRG